MIDWHTVLVNIGSRKSMKKVGQEVNACPVNLRRIRRGEVKEPKFSVGVKLLDMHLDMFPDKHKRIQL